MKRNSVVSCAFVALALGISPVAQAMGKKPATPPETSTGKRVVSLQPVCDVSIEMPDGTFHDFGGDFAQELENELTQSGRYLVEVPSVETSQALTARDASPPDYEWPGSVTPAATLTIAVEAMSFQTGSYGDRMFYGFNERFRTPFNDGFSSVANEFPLKQDSSEPSWFGQSFDQRGSVPFDSQSGLDLGDGFNIDALFAWLSVKYASYHAELHLRMDINAPLAGVQEYRMVTVTGDGFFFDVAGAYAGYSAGISVARTDAMSYALGNAISGTYSAIDRAITPLPLTAKIDNVLPDGTVLLGTGPDAAVVPGTLYELVDHPETQLEAVLSNSSGTEARLAAGDPSLVVPGVFVREALAGLAPPIESQPQLAAQARVASASSVPAAVESISLPSTNIPQADLDGLSPAVSWLEAFWKSLVEAVFLPYRIWRYFEYDQAYSNSSGSVSEQGVMTAHSAPTDSSAWSQQARATSWAKQIGLAGTPAMSVQGAPIVAVIDSGVDYNHWTLHNHLWLNPTPSSGDGSGAADGQDVYGWDFIAGDAHPYDDGYHGTEVASLVSAVAPASPIMPLKIFNPWGVTSSAAIYGAFAYAVDHGARIIVCGWATQQDSQAIRQGVVYAHDHGVAVVAAAGDLGAALAKQPEYPAVLSAEDDNVLTVAGVDSSDHLTASGTLSNYDSQLVGIAAPGQGIHASTPRSASVTDTSTGLASAITAGALARLIASSPALAAQAPSAWIEALRSQADSVPQLEGNVSGGLRLRVKF